MISLKPIPRIIQQRLFDKMRVLGRTDRYNTNLSNRDNLITKDMIDSRSTFIHMASNQKNPVLLSGGELIEDNVSVMSPKSFFDSTILGTFAGKRANRLAAGYEDMYGKNKRPIPGIKSIDVSFKGGTRAHRNATINWTCWSFDDINRLVKKELRRVLLRMFQI